jgi:hypothetical protein
MVRILPVSGELVNCDLRRFYVKNAGEMLVGWW